MEEAADHKNPKWLRRLQENSWEAEILISGGAIFSLLQLSGLIADWSGELKEMRRILGHNEILVFLNLGINGITVGFFVHLTLRGFWIALVCLNYAYPAGVNFTRLKITGKYLEQARSVSLTNQILKLDHIAGLFFFGSLAFVLVVIGVITYTIVYLLIDGIIGSFLEIPFEWSGKILMVYLLPYGIFLFDFLGSGILRRNKVIGTIYKPFYYFLNYVTLAFLYRPWFQVLFSNLSKWKAALVGILFFFVCVTLTAFTIVRPLNLRNLLDSRSYMLLGGPYRSDNYYENRLTEAMPIRFVCIQSDIVSDGYLRVFLPYNSFYDETISSHNAKTLMEIFTLKIDKDAVMPDWYWGKRFISGQYGLFCYLPIAQIPNGKHELTIEVKDNSKPFPLVVPFWKQ